MFDWIRESTANVSDWIQKFILNLFDFKRNAKLLIIGLDNAGKSTLLDRMHSGRLIQHPPTNQTRSQELELGNVRFTAFDLGGHPQVRRVWREYLLAIDGVLFMVDSADPNRLQEAMTELDSVIHHEDSKDVPIAILLNKVDRKDALGEEYLRNALKLGIYTTGKEHIPRQNLPGRPLETFPCSVLKQCGYGEALRWLAYYVD